MDFEESHPMELVPVDHEHLRCTLGQWLPKENRMALFPASKVPHVSYISASLYRGGRGTNQLMTGLFKNYRKGRHKYQAPTSHDAFRMDFAVPVRRTADDLDYDQDDRIEYTRPYDNIHAAYNMGLNHNYFASAGCQVIMGYPKTKDPFRYNQHTGPWARFLKTAYSMVGQTNFYYGLFNGRDVHKVSDQDVGRPMTPRLRFGSHDRAFLRHYAYSPYQLVRNLQRALNGEGKGYYSGYIDGDFGPRTFKAVQAFQLEAFGPDSDDCIVGPITARALGIDWPAGNFDSDQPYG